MRFEFGKGHFDRIEIGTVWWQEQQPATTLLQCLCRAWTFVGGQVAEDGNSTRIKCRDQLRLDIGDESRAVDYPWRDKGVLRQTGNERLSTPLAEGCGAIEPFPDRRSSTQPR